MVPMSESQREVEVKLAFSSAEEAFERITALGAVVETPRVFEDNVVFERDDDSLREKGQTLRLRRTGDRSIVTLKSRVQGEFRHKVRQEDESEVADADAMERVFLGLGYRHGWRYQKYRTLFRLDELLHAGAVARVGLPARHPFVTTVGVLLERQQVDHHNG